MPISPRTLAMKLIVSSQFDSGNIIVVGEPTADAVNLQLRPEPFTHGTDNKAHSQVRTGPFCQQNRVVRPPPLYSS